MAAIKWLLIKALVLFFGMGLLIISHSEFRNTQRFLDNAHRAEGTVIALHRSMSDSGASYFPVIAFSTRAGESVEFRSNSGGNPPNHKVGDKVAVRYLPDEPYQAKEDEFLALWGFVMIAGLFGLLLFAIGVGAFVFPYLKRGRVEKLKQQGLSVLADIKAVRVNTSISINGRHPYQILATWKDPKTNIEREFVSDNIWADLSTRRVPEKVKVYHDGKNSSNYHVEIDGWGDGN